MIVFKDCYAKVWEIERNNNFTNLKISTSSKQKDNSYIYSHWRATAVGHAHNKAKKLNEGDSIKITKGAVKNELYQPKDNDKKKLWLSVVIWEFDILDSNSKKESKEEKQQNYFVLDKDEELPF